MADELGVEISGLDELLGMFEELGTVGTKGALTAAMKKAVKPIAAEANRLAPVGPPASGAEAARRAVRPARPLRGSVKVRTTLNKWQNRKRGGRKYAVEVFVGSTAPHAHLIEFGHRQVVRISTTTGKRAKRGRKGLGLAKRTIGFVSPRPFLRPAFDMHGKQSVRTFFSLVGKELQRVVARYTKQAERGKLSKGARVAFKVDI